MDGDKTVQVASNHYQIVKDSLTGKRAIDEQTFASLSVLTERLERLKKLGKAFSEITFSPAVEELRSRQNTMVAGQRR